MSKKALNEQLALFGLKPTAAISKHPFGQVAMELLELSEPPKDLMQYGKPDTSRRR